MQFLARSSFANAAQAGDANGSPGLAGKTSKIDSAVVSAIGLGLLIGLIAPRCGRPS